MMRNEQKNTAATAVCVMNNKLSTGWGVDMTIMSVMPKISSTDHTCGILSWILTYLPIANGFSQSAVIDVAHSVRDGPS